VLAHSLPSAHRGDLLEEYEASKRHYSGQHEKSFRSRPISFELLIVTLAPASLIVGSGPH